MWEPEDLKKLQDGCRAQALLLLEEYGVTLAGGDKEAIRKVRKKLARAARMLYQLAGATTDAKLLFPTGDPVAAAPWVITVGPKGGGAPHTTRLTVRGYQFGFASAELAKDFLDAYEQDPQSDYGIMRLEELNRARAEAGK